MAPGGVAPEAWGWGAWPDGWPHRPGRPGHYGYYGYGLGPVAYPAPVVIVVAPYPLRPYDLSAGNGPYVASPAGAARPMPPAPSWDDPWADEPADEPSDDRPPTDAYSPRDATRDATRAGRRAGRADRAMLAVRLIDGRRLLRLRWLGGDPAVREVTLLVADSARRVLATQTVREAPYAAVFERIERAAFVGTTLVYADGGSTTTLLPLTRALRSTGASTGRP